MGIGNGRWLARVRRRLESLRQELGRWGLLRVVHMRLMRILHPVLVLCYVTTRTLGGREQRNGHACCAVRLATCEELLAAASDPALYLYEDEVERALARGDICIAAFDGERMVAYTWRAFCAAPHSRSLWVSFEKPYRYAYKAFTLPAYRGRHLQEWLAPLTDQLCCERGYTRGISFIETHNYASLTMSYRTGSRVVGMIGYMRMFGHVYPFRTPAARRLGFGFITRPDAA